MSEQRRFGESDHEPLREDDILAQAIGQWRDEPPSKDLWPGVMQRITPVAPELRRSAGGQQFTFTLSQLALAASLLIAVASGLTWLATKPLCSPVVADAASHPAYGAPKRRRARSSRRICGRALTPRSPTSNRFFARSVAVLIRAPC